METDGPSEMFKHRLISSRLALPLSSVLSLIFATQNSTCSSSPDLLRLEAESLECCWPFSPWTNQLMLSKMSGCWLVEWCHPWSQLEAWHHTRCWIEKRCSGYECVAQQAKPLRLWSGLLVWTHLQQKALKPTPWVPLHKAALHCWTCSHLHVCDGELDGVGKKRISSQGSIKCHHYYYNSRLDQSSLCCFQCNKAWP